MVSVNRLLGSGRTVIPKEDDPFPEDGTVETLYRYDCPEGREFKGSALIKMMKYKKWTATQPEQPEELDESDKGSKIDLSDDDEE